MAASFQADPSRPLPSQDCYAAARCKELFDEGAILSCQGVSAFELDLAGQRHFPPPSTTQERHCASRSQIEPGKRTFAKPIAYPVEVISSAFGAGAYFLKRENLDVLIRPLQGVNDGVWINRELLSEFILIGVPSLPEFAAHRPRRSSQCGRTHISRSLPQDRGKPPHPHSEGRYRAKSEKFSRVKTHNCYVDIIDCRRIDPRVSQLDH